MPFVCGRTCRRGNLPAPGKRGRVLKVLVDENIPRRSVTELVRRGHDVKDIRATEFEGTGDCTLWKMAVDEKRVLITTDKWFGTNRSRNHPGVLAVLLKQPNRERIHSRVIMGIERFGENEWPGLVVTLRDTVQSVRRMA